MNPDAVDHNLAGRAEAIDALLPQTQCTRCGYPDCRRYAEAIAGGEADINQCPPGGAAGIIKLAALLGRAAKPLDPANGIEKPLEVAFVREAECIGCTLCIQACPVDAIAGGPKFLHTVIADLCTGCELCVPPCPVDCIDMIPARDRQEWTQQDADAARERYARHDARLAQERIEHERLLEEKRRQSVPQDEHKRALIAAAMRRAKEQRAAAEEAQRTRQQQPAPAANAGKPK